MQITKELSKHIAIEKKNILEPKEFKDKGFRVSMEWPDE
jgi:hypothetical protein